MGRSSSGFTPPTPTNDFDHSLPAPVLTTNGTSDLAWSVQGAQPDAWKIHRTPNNQNGFAAWQQLDGEFLELDDIDESIAYDYKVVRCTLAGVPIPPFSNSVTILGS